MTDTSTEAGNEATEATSADAGNATQEAAQQAPEHTHDTGQETAAAAPAKETAPKDWRANLPEELREHPTLAKFTSEEALAQSYVNLERTLGAEKVALPKSADDTEGWERVYKAIGRPDDPKGYEFKDVTEQLPEGFDYPKETEDAFRDVAHKAGLSVNQAQTLRDWFLENASAQHAQQMQTMESAPQLTMAELQKEWGNATGQKIAAAQHAVTQHMGQEFMDALEETGLGNDARLIRGFAKLAEITGADKDLTGRGVTSATPGELQDQISNFRTQHKEALFDKVHPEHNRRVQELSALYQKLHPEQAA